MPERDPYILPKRKLGLRISQLRDRKGLSQRQLAMQLELDRVTLNQIESGTGNPTFETLIRIADGLGADVEDLFERDEDLEG
ncbi:helix-turn-helix transcriptional regulator [Raoultibacter timonensis]|uniref:helix-turn-helix transcriptional regulator n=1 Tax=Raoultibacter timonensis TaxID=1907662 RepID=UPI000C823562|nr:helix-turn-helix transcriptional regulator [Raoultibacter timonensis]